ncbi:MAG: M1 family metallopeptidase [Caldisphaeraceae archaeon]|nr:M1 family metallopeptidase [Caldisphaeraceae archaeon]
MNAFQSLKVKRYNICMDFDGTKYKGIEKIEMTSNGDVTLDAVGLEIKGAKVNGKNVEFKQDNDHVVIRSGPFSGILEVEFSGEAIERLVGIYKAKYGNDYVISTQFEAVHARRMFPCIDNPAYKATFRITLKIAKNLHAISNMPIKSIEYDGDKKIISFYETPPMSTYLLYVGIGRWEELGKGKIIIATTKGKTAMGEFASWIAENSIDFYERYFGFPYMLPKMHLIAVPEFAFGAMENWGAITFRESAMLAKEDSGLGQLKRVGEVVAHEIAHHWFGDLVTMKWWDDLWLNESFATFMAFKAVDSFIPSWKMWDDFLARETSGAMLRDSLSTTHPIHVEVKDPEEIERIFDDISYGKGANILRMVEYFLGESFRAGLSNYLNHFKYSNAKANDLWESLQAFSNYPIKEMMNSWIMQPGYPYIKVSLENGKLLLEQHRFSLVSKLDDNIYMIPIAMKVNKKRHDFMMDRRLAEVEISGVENLKVNLDRSGFYRVFYNISKDMIEEMNPKEKWGMINDYYNFLLAGLSSLNDYLEVVNKNIEESAYLPVEEMSSELFNLTIFNKNVFKDLALKYHSKQYELQGKLEDINSRYLRGNIARRLAILDKDFAQELSSMFGKEVEPDMREAVYTAYAVATSDFEKLKEMYIKSELDSEKIKYLRAMMFMSDPSEVSKALEWGEKNVKLQDLLVLMTSSLNESARHVAWDWFKSSGFNKLSKAFEGTAILGRSLMRVIPYFGLVNDKEVEEFFANSPLSQDPGVRSGLEIMKAYIKISKI